MNISEELPCNDSNVPLEWHGKTGVQFLSSAQLGNYSQPTQVLESRYRVSLSLISNMKIFSKKTSGFNQNIDTSAILFFQKQSKVFVFHGKRNNGRISKAAAKLKYSLNFSADKGEEVILTQTRSR